MDLLFQVYPLRQKIKLTVHTLRNFVYIRSRMTSLNLSDASWRRRTGKNGKLFATMRGYICAKLRPKSSLPVQNSSLPTSYIWHFFLYM